MNELVEHLKGVKNNNINEHKNRLKNKVFDVINSIKYNNIERDIYNTVTINELTVIYPVYVESTCIDDSMYNHLPIIVDVMHGETVRNYYLYDYHYEGTIEDTIRKYFTGDIHKWTLEYLKNIQEPQIEVPEDKLLDALCWASMNICLVNNNYDNLNIVHDKTMSKDIFYKYHDLYDQFLSDYSPYFNINGEEPV